MADLVTALALGSLTVSATSNGITGSTPVAVQASTLTSITVLPANGSIAASTTVQFHALGNYSDGSTQNLTRQVTWASSNTGVAQVINTGASRGVAPGTTTITATLGSVSGSTTLTVTMPRSYPLTLCPRRRQLQWRPHWISLQLAGSAMAPFKTSRAMRLGALTTPRSRRWMPGPRLPRSVRAQPTFLPPSTELRVQRR